MEDKKVEALKNKVKLDDLLVRRNFVEFNYEGNNKNEKLRIRKSNTAEEMEARDKRDELRVELLKNDKYLLREQLVDVYKKKGIEVDKFDKDWNEIQKEIDSTSCILTELNNTPKEKKEDIDRLEAKIAKLENSQLKISKEKSQLLSYCIEDKCTHFWFMYMTFLSTEIMTDDKWIRKWNTYEEMIKDEVELVSLCLVKTIEFIAGFGVPVDL